jgi:hypothetical protein
MATKKKAKKGTKSKRTSGKKLKGSTRAVKKAAPKKMTPKKKAGASSRKAIGTARSSRQNATRKNSTRDSAAFEPRPVGARSGGQAGDLQGLRDVEGADSESVSELLDEGNAFEASVVEGVEHVEDDEEREVHTHEVPEDDVPEEYLDKD